MTIAWTRHYQAPQMIPWQGRMDAPHGSYFFQAIQMLNLLETIHSYPQKMAFGLIGFCCDEGIRRNFGRTGAFEGPFEIRKYLASLPIHQQNFICYDAGNVLCLDQDLEAAQHALAEVVALLLQHHIVPIVMGGGHELAFGHYQGIEKFFTNVFTKEKLGIVNFDAHFDMRPLLPGNKGSSGTPFLQIATAHDALYKNFNYYCIGIQQTGNINQLFETAKNYQSQILSAEDVQHSDRDKCINFINSIIDQNQHIYLSLCLDVFAFPYAPGVSAPQVFGLTPWQILPLVRQLAASGKVISYDVAELSPQYDIDQRTAKLAAHFIYEILHHHLPHHRVTKKI